GTRRHRAPVNGVASLGAVVTAFLPDGKHALTGVGRTLTFWDVASGKEGRFLTGSGRRMGGPAVSADGKRAVTGGKDGEVLLWDLEGARAPGGWRASPGPTSASASPSPPTGGWSRPAPSKAVRGRATSASGTPRRARWSASSTARTTSSATS